jgi:hypothetical protein
MHWAVTSFQPGQTSVCQPVHLLCVLLPCTAAASSLKLNPQTLGCSWHVLLKKLVVPVTSFGFPANITTQGLALLANTPVALLVRALSLWLSEN